MNLSNLQFLFGVGAGSSLLIIVTLYPIAERTALQNAALGSFAAALPLLSAAYFVGWHRKFLRENLARGPRIPQYTKIAIFGLAYFIGAISWVIGMVSFFLSIGPGPGVTFFLCLGLASLLILVLLKAEEKRGANPRDGSEED